jgi:hypothetical protein
MNERNWLIWSGKHQKWWAPDERGYTTELSKAGWYTKPEAMRIQEASRPRGAERSVAIQVRPPQVEAP